MGDAISKPFKGKSEPLRVLCFGDSLTEGYSKFGLIMTPYSNVLTSELEVKFWAGENKRKVEVVTDGQSGDLVTAGIFRGRMTSKCGFWMSYSIFAND